MLKFSRFFIAVNVFFVFNSCQQEKEPVDNQVKSIEAQPSLVPKSVRLQQYNRGNLVLNPSFEIGKYFYEDSLIGTFDLKAWKKVGNNVEWISELEDSSLTSEIREGKHSIKIYREEFNEVDELGDGIMSDFIKVIPGNYALTFDVKLHHIVSNLRRFGLKLHDAVNIRLFFFDKNKLPIDAASYNSFTKSTIDKSFKGYSFSNFSEITDFEWGKVRGKSYNHPELEGTIPYMAKYVKIFLGLKGKGSMWVDNVNFSYSRFNFSPLEIYEQYTDSRLTRSELIVPTPKYIEALSVVKYFGDSSNFVSEPVILIPSKPSREVMRAAKLVQNTLNGIFNTILDTIGVDYIKIIDEIGEETNTDAFIISIGPSVLFKINRKGLPLEEIGRHEQSYFIKNIPKVQNVLYLFGEQPIANFYAASTLIQLFEKSEFIFHNTGIIDYPDFLKRSYLLAKTSNISVEKSIEDMSFLKFNNLYLNANGNRNGLLKMVSSCKKNFTEVSISYSVDSYLIHEIEVDEFGRELHYKQNYKRAVIERLKNDVLTGLRYGASAILLQGAEQRCYQPGISVAYMLRGDDKDRFVSIQNADASILKSLSKTMSKYYPNVELQFFPPYYTRELIANSNGFGEQYFNELMPHISKNINLLWSGSTSHSLSLDMADLLYFKSFSGKIPVYIDNSFLADSLSCFYTDEDSSPEMIRKYNIFHPFQADLPANLHLMIEGKHMVINKFPYGEIDKIRLATVSDYLWNTKAYDPDLSLWKVLVSMFTENVAMELLLFNDDYYNLYDLCNKITKERIKNRYKKQGENIIEELDIRFELLGIEVNNQKLIEELKLKKESVVGLFKKLTN